jgi:hypothetical protein
MDKESAITVYEYLLKKGYNPIDNPMASTYPKIGRTERHGNNNSGLFITSQDGISAYDVDYYGDNPYQDSAKILTYWIDEMNGRYTGLKVWVDPRDRTYFPEDSDYKKLRLIMKSSEPIPTKKKYKLIKAPQIFKTSAEDYKNEDPRAGQPCFITKEKVKQFDILNFKTEKVIGRLGYYGTFEGGRYRYYLGYPSLVDDHQSIIAKNNGSEWVLLKSGDFKYLVNIIRRTGVER